MNCASDSETIQEIRAQRDIFRELVLLAYSHVKELYFMPSNTRTVFAGCPSDTPVSWRELVKQHLGIEEDE